MRVLVIGGSVFLGRHVAAEALRRGHRVTVFNRGRSGQDVPGAEAVRGDRENAADLAKLADGRTWDLVVDTCGFTPRVVARSARSLSGRADTYAFVSTVSATATWPARPTGEHSPRHECSPDAGPADGGYGVLKAGCERAVETYFAGNSLILVPGLILGPYDNIGRLPWWLRRIARGGRVLAPGRPDIPMQAIDARDLAAFALDRVGTQDRFLVTGPAGGTAYGRLLADCAAVTGSDAEFVWVDDRFLLEREVAPWTELPLWAPEAAGMGAVWQVATAKAEAAGLRCRPVTETVRDTWAWLREAGLPERPARYRGAAPETGIAPEKETRILAEWDARRPPRPSHLGRGAT